MSETLRTIRLYGVLGTRFGRVHRLAVSSTREAIRALGVVVPGFRDFLVSSKDAGLTFAVFRGKTNLSKDELEHPVGGRDEIRIAPMLIGSKNAGLFQTILGAVIIAIAWINPFNTLTGPMVTAAYGMGASMMLGGVVQMLSPQTSGLASSSGSNGTSYYFNGAVNSSAQGDPVPILYGRMRVGSKRISSGIYAEDQI